MNTQDNFDLFINGVNPWWNNQKYHFDVKNRDYYLDIIKSNTNRLINILIGARRVGKTSILRSLINKHLSKYDAKKIIYIPADLKEVRDRGIVWVVS